MDKRYERSWLRGLKTHFAGNTKGKNKAAEDAIHLVRRGDIVSVPVWLDKPVGEDETSSSSEDSECEEGSARSPHRQRSATGVVYFIVTALSYELLVPFEEDFRSSISSKARAGELGCWVDAGEKGTTEMVLVGVEKARVRGREGDRAWHAIGMSMWCDLY